MAHLWLVSEDDWIVFPIHGKGVSPPGQESVRVVPVSLEEEEPWALLVRPTPQNSGVHVNGWPFLSGLTILSDGDEIRVGADDAWFFSTERLAQVVALPACDPAPVCPRCKQPIESETDSTAVRCPQCDVWYHETAALPCWSYAKTCALCDQPTDFEAGYSWTPTTL
jgi:hypothetical protein